MVGQFIFSWACPPGPKNKWLLLCSIKRQVGPLLSAGLALSLTGNVVVVVAGIAGIAVASVLTVAASLVEVRS